MLSLDECDQASHHPASHQHQHDSILAAVAGSEQQSASPPSVSALSEDSPCNAACVSAKAEPQAVHASSLPHRQLLAAYQQASSGDSLKAVAHHLQPQPQTDLHLDATLMQQPQSQPISSSLQVQHTQQTILLQEQTSALQVTTEATSQQHGDWHSLTAANYMADADALQHPGMQQTYVASSSGCSSSRLSSSPSTSRDADTGSKEQSSADVSFATGSSETSVGCYVQRLISTQSYGRLCSQITTSDV